MLFQASHLYCTFGLPSHSGRLSGNELARRREDMAKAASEL